MLRHNYKRKFRLRSGEADDRRSPIISSKTNSTCPSRNETAKTADKLVSGSERPNKNNGDGPLKGASIYASPVGFSTRFMNKNVAF